jgi:hypothetical protein
MWRAPINAIQFGENTWQKGRGNMLETYVRMVNKHKPKGFPATYCPIDVEKGEITIGLSLIGCYPKGAKIVGTFNEDTQKLTLFKSQQTKENLK